MDLVSLTANGWTAAEVLRARTFRDSWRGIKSVPEGAGLLLRTRSVHGFGLAAPLQIAAISHQMEVYSLRRLRPGRVLFFPGARFVLELPLGTDPPRLGSRVEIRSG